jgi:hypothetical protein
MMRKIIATVLALTMMTGAAVADGWSGHRACNFNGCYGGGYHHRYYQERNHNDWVEPLVGGMIIGGMLMNQPRYYEAPRYHTECRVTPMYDQWGYYLGNQRQCYTVPNY